MGWRSSLHEHFVHVKALIGLEQIEVGKSRTATTSLTDLRKSPIPPSCRAPFSYFYELKRVKKVASNLLKIAKQVAYG